MERIKKIVMLVLVFTMKLLTYKRTPSHKSKNFSNEKGPQILKNVSNLIFKRTVVDF